MRDFFGSVSAVLNDPAFEGQPAERLKAIRRRVDEVFDAREASMLALGREWAARTPREQNEFVALFAELVERSFISRVAGKATLAGGLRVDYLNEATTGDGATVETEIAARDGNALRLDFQLVQRNGRWVVRDVVMDGVSTMDNYHAQFQRLARDGTWADVVAQLRARVAGAEGTEVAAAAPVSAPAPAPTPMMWPSELRARDRVAEPLAPVPAPPASVGVVQAPAPVAQTPTTPDPPPAPATARPVVATPPPKIAPPLEIAAPAPDPVVSAPRAVTVAATTSALRERVPAPSVWIQVGAFRSAAAAGRVATEVRGEILVVATPASAEPPLLRVRVGPFTDRAQALSRLQELQARGWRAYLVE
jgi:phospholipid transport system substrate-binding protein